MLKAAEESPYEAIESVYELGFTPNSDSKKPPRRAAQTADKPVDIFGGFFLFRDDDVLLSSFTMLDGR